MWFKNKNIFSSARLKLDLITSCFLIFILTFFSFTIYKLLTVDIIYQISPIFRVPEIKNYINSEILFSNFKSQTIFLLISSDILIFSLSIFLFDRFVKKMLSPIEYLSNIQNKFAENISHELRTPLSIINMNTEILNNNFDKELIIQNSENSFFSKNQKNINNIKDEVNNITLLIDDLLFEARLKYKDEKKENLYIKDLFIIIEKVFQNLKSLKNYEVNFILDKEIFDKYENYFLNINNIHIERIFNNLLSNSFKYTLIGEVKISFEIYKKNNKDKLKIIFYDTGIGINKKEIKKVFDRFYRTEEVDGKIGGTGIGLSIVKDILNKYNFKLKIESEEKKWTRIEIDNIDIKNYIKK